jgi:ABC-type branched-subunit amino acid transport system substrate-binding protein
VPLLHWSGSSSARGRWTFHYQAGSMADEPPVIVDWLVRKGYRTVGLVRDTGVVGDQYYQAWRQAVAKAGLRVVMDQPTDVERATLRAALQAMRARGARALVWLGFGPSSFLVAELLREIGWSPPAIGNIGLGRMGVVYPGVSETVAGQGLDGWLRTDMVDEHNPVYQEMVAWYTPRFGPPPPVFQPAFGWDLATLILEALDRAPECSCDGLRRGLERIANVPACCGAAGTVMGFSPTDHGALKGSRLFVLREIWQGALRPYAS